MLQAQAHGGSAFLSIISAMITPAILILASGSLVSSTLTRLARIVDRARLLLDRLSDVRAGGDRPADERLITGWLTGYQQRAALTERALTMLYVAIGLFVAGSLAITIDSLTHDAVPWLSLALVVTGAIFLFSGTAALVIETNIATGTLRSEIESVCRQREPGSSPPQAKI